MDSHAIEKIRKSTMKNRIYAEQRTCMVDVSPKNLAISIQTKCFSKPSISWETSIRSSIEFKRHHSSDWASRSLLDISITSESMKVSTISYCICDYSTGVICTFLVFFVRRLLKFKFAHHHWKRFLTNSENSFNID